LEQRSAFLQLGGALAAEAAPHHKLTCEIAMMRRRPGCKVCSTLAAIAALSTTAAQAQLPAFPGAQGFGALATGGRGGEVFHVTTTAGTSTGTYEGPNGYNRGTLRWCITNESSSLPRTIVFDVSGQVTLASQITVENSNLTIAGQTAPGQGLTSQGKPWLFESGNNLVIRHVRNRLGRNGGQDSMGVEGGTNIIFDHVTSTWSNDEALSVAKTGTLVTVQNSYIYEGLNHSGHGYGSLIRPDIDSKVSYHHNLYANNESRNPRPGTYNSKTLDFDFRNNVIYNWGDRAGYSGGSSEGNPEHVNMNFVGNYAIAGASTDNNVTYAFVTDTNADLKAYQSGNLIDSDKNAVRNGVDTGWGMFRDDAGNPGVLTQMASPFPLATIPVTTSSAQDAYDDVLDYGGAFWWNRDTADTRIVTQVRTQTGALINHESDVGGFPTLPVETRAANWDTDHDGMPDAWESKHTLNPNLATDRNNDFDTDGFTNLEEYLNEVGASPAPTPIAWNGSNGRFALNQNWSVWQPSRFDDVRINSGTSTVDAIGQAAGRIAVAPDAANTATLRITAGRLDVAEEVVIGSNTSTGTLQLSGGVLKTPLLSKGSGGAFQFTGGTLSAETVAFPLVNNGGTIAPGASPGMMHVQGDLTLNSGVLEIEIGGKMPGQFDHVAVDGVAHLGGTLRVKLLDLGGGAYVPQVGDMIPFLSSAGTSGSFAALDLPPLPSGLTWQIAPGNVATFLAVVAPWNGNPADFTRDGVVNAADLARWRGNFGAAGQLDNTLGDADADGDIDGRDFLVWQRNLGATGPAVAVPEPASLALVAVAGLAIGRLRVIRIGSPNAARGRQ
jgi:pectate lyase